MRYIWQVIEKELENTGDSKYPHLPEMQCGVVNTFAEGLNALSSWHGAEDDPANRLYQIMPLLEDENRDFVEEERTRITAYLMYNTTYSEDFCVRCSHETTNCNCPWPVYMRGWYPNR